MYMKLIIYLILLFHIFLEKKCNCTNLNVVAFSYTESTQVFTVVVNKFNEYARKNNIDINLKIELYTENNSTSVVDDFGSTIELLLKKNKNKYDLYFYDNMYSPRYSSYLVDLRDWLPEEHIAMYSSGIASESCTYKGKWVGLPLTTEYVVLYSNTGLLNKYEKEIPKTWDELIETGKFILENERKNGNIDLIGYNGLFPEQEAAIMSALEFIYSFRKTKDSPYPKYTDQEAIDALNKIKEVKDALSSDEIFKMNEVNTVINLFSGNALFLRFFDLPIANPVYNKTILVGNKEGVSASSLGGSNIGINRAISNTKIKDAAKVLEFFTSFETQKYLVTKHFLASGIKSLYDDEDVCKIVNCELIKNIQFIARPSSLTNNYNEYSTTFRNYLYEFLYGDKNAEEVLNKINDITKIYKISIKLSHSSSGLIIFIINMIICIITIIT